MGSGSSSSRQNTPDKSMPEPTPGSRSNGSQRSQRGRTQFEEVQLQDPNASPARRTSQSEGASGGASGGARGGAPVQPSYQQNAPPPQQIRQPPQGQAAAPTRGQQPGYQGGFGGAEGQWQSAGNQVQTGHQVLNQFQTYKQPKLAIQPGQNPDEFFSMALQLQEMVS